MELPTEQRSAVQSLTATPTGVFDGAPYVAMKRCTGCGGRMWPPSVRPSVELPVGSQNAVLGMAVEL
eukprot:3156102-Pyramimonas_sp.AAC.1